MAIERNGFNRTTNCSFCGCTLTINKYATHLDKYHQNGAVKPRPNLHAKPNYTLADILEDGVLEPVYGKWKV